MERVPVGALTNIYGLYLLPHPQEVYGLNVLPLLCKYEGNEENE